LIVADETPGALAVSPDDVLAAELLAGALPAAELVGVAPDEVPWVALLCPLLPHAAATNAATAAADASRTAPRFTVI
jgi:hypothetical protein